MAAQNYSDGDNPPAARSGSRPRHRRGASSAVNAPSRHGPAQLASEHPLAVHPAQAALEPGGPAFPEHASPMHGVLLPPPPRLPEADAAAAAAAPNDFAWAPHHIRTHSSFAPPAHLRQPSTLYQSHAPLRHTRDQSASDFYFLQSPHASPSLAPGLFDPLSTDPGMAVGRTPRLPVDTQARAPRSLHIRGGSVSKQSPTRSHRRTATFSSQSGIPPFPVPGPSPLIGIRSGAGPGPSMLPPSPLPPPGSAPVNPGSRPGQATQLTSRAAMRAEADPGAVAVPGTASRGPEPSGLVAGPAKPVPMPSMSTTEPLYAGYSIETASPQQSQEWSSAAATAGPSRSRRTASPERRHRSHGRGRHSRRRTKEGSNAQDRYSPPPASPPVLSAVNPMSDFGYPSMQGYQYGLGIGLAGPPPVSPRHTSSQLHAQLTPVLPSSQFSAGAPGSLPEYGAEVGPETGAALPAPPRLHAGAPAPPTQPQRHYMDRLGPFIEGTPGLRSMPFLPPYVPYDQQLQQEREQEELQHHLQQHPQRQYPQHQYPQHHHLPQLQHFEAHQHGPQHGLQYGPQHLHSYAQPYYRYPPQYLVHESPQMQWRDDDAWQNEYWSSPQRFDRPPVAGPSTVPRYVSEPYQYLEMPAWPAAQQQGWSGDYMFAPPDPLAGSQHGSMPEAPMASSSSVLLPRPRRMSTGRLVADFDRLAFDVPGPDYDESARMEWGAEDVQELMRLLEPAEKHKWRYMSDLLTETRKKRIPLRTCQNKFHALFGETESSSKLRSSLFYVAYRSGWSSIQQSRTMQEQGGSAARVEVSRLPRLPQQLQGQAGAAESAGDVAADDGANPTASRPTDSGESENLAEGGGRT